VLVRDRIHQRIDITLELWEETARRERQ